MAKLKVGSPTLIEKLNQPISWKAFVEVMTHEISVAGKGGVKDFADLDVEVERLLRQAEVSAHRRGVSVEQVLSEMGLVSENVITDEASLGREQLLRDLGWENRDESFLEEHSNPVKEQNSNPDPKKKFDDVSILRRVQELLPGLTMDEISNFLGCLSMYDSLAEKLILCNILTEEQFNELQKARDNYEGVPLWRLILLVGGELDSLVELMEGEPWFPLLDDTEGDFAEYLLEQGLISYRQFKDYTKNRQEGAAPTLHQIDEMLGGDSKVHELMAGFFGLPLAEESQEPFSESLSTSLVRFFHVFDAVPLQIEAEQYIFGVMRPPSQLMKKMVQSFIAPVSFQVLSKESFFELRSHIEKQLKSSRSQSNKRMQAKEFVELRERVANTSAVRLVEELFAKALEVGATDIHMEHQEAGFRVRFRVDSILRDAMYIHPALADEVTSRIKILADMDITERRQPQDGHIKTAIGEHELNMRVATVPTYHGERIGIRLVNSGKMQLTLEQLGLDAQDMARLDRLASRPYGMVLTTGPVGSGKTTTLYSNLARLNAEEANIITIEDPVEYELEGVNQIEVNYRINFGFAEGLRAVLRQDPNVILLGEIRDHETAAIAVRASMTGLLVFSSLHTNDAVGAVTTFHNFQIPPLLIANSLLGVIAQRLVRRLCSECKETYLPSAEELEMFASQGVSLDSGTELCRAVGCETCFYSGYKGRVGLFEILEVTSEMRELIMHNASEMEMRDLAIANGMRLLSNDALRKVKMHWTSIDEVKRVVFL